MTVHGDSGLGYEGTQVFIQVAVALTTNFPCSMSGWEFSL